MFEIDNGIYDRIATGKKLTAIDLFCGAGGTTTGFAMSGLVDTKICINHDENAIRNHKINHPECLHVIEDIRDFNVKLLPEINILWASLECTHFSVAKGGDSRDPDSRSLANYMPRYIRQTNPDYFIVENVMEFRNWSVLRQKTDKNGDLVFKASGEPWMIPDTNTKGEGLLYLAWVETICRLGYWHKWQKIDVADHNAYTSRSRYIGVFAKKGLPISFPNPTNHKQGGKIGLKPWRPVREVLDFSNPGKSVFGREKPLVDNTLRKIRKGLEKFHKSNTSYFIKYYGSGKNIADVNQPSPTITTKDFAGLVSIDFLYNQFGNGSSCQAIPADAIISNGSHSFIPCFLSDYDNYNKVYCSVNKPHPTVLASKRYTRLIEVVGGKGQLIIKNADSRQMIKLKKLCKLLGIKDIKMRMLTVDELLKIQGFPANYKLEGTQEQMKKYIGNSVVPILACRLIEKLHQVLLANTHKKAKIA